MGNSYLGVNFNGASSGGGGFENPATADLSMGAFNVLSSGGNNTWTVLPAAGGAGIAAAIQAAVDAGNGGKIQLMAGDYTFSAQQLIDDRMSGITLEGIPGKTRLIHDGSFDGYCLKFLSDFVIGAGLNIDNTTAGDTSITFTTHSNAALVQAGDTISFTGTDALSEADMEVHVAAANGNGTSGVVTLVSKVQKTMTSVISAATIQIRGGERNYIKNLSVVLNAAPATLAGGIHLGLWKNSGVENVTFEGFSAAPTDGSSAALLVWDSQFLDLKGVKVNGASNNGLFIATGSDILIENCDFTNCINGGGTGMGVRLNTVIDSEITGCTFDGVDNGVAVVSSNPTRRVKISDENEFRSVKYRAVDLGQSACRDCTVSGNNFKYLSNEYGVYITKDRHQVLNNVMDGVKFPIYVESGVGNKVEGNTIINSGSYAIVVGGSRTSVQRNTVYKGCGGDAAILVTAASHNQVSGNLLSDITGKGINMSGDSDDNQVLGNLIYTTSGDAITVGNSCDNNMVDHNHLRGLTLTQGTGTGNTFNSNLT